MKLLTESHMSNMGKKGSVPASREVRVILESQGRRG